MSWQAIRWIMEQADIPATPTLVGIAIGEHADIHGRDSYPSLVTLIKKTRLSRHTVIRGIQNLESTGKLIVERKRTAAGDWDHNVYHLTIPAEWKPSSATAALGSDSIALPGSATAAPRVVPQLHQGSAIEAGG